MPLSLGIYSQVLAGKLYTGMAHFRPASTVRQVQVGLSWKDSNNNLLSTSLGALFTEIAGDWVQAVVEAVAPTNAYYVNLVGVVKDAVAGETHYLDENGIFMGFTNIWTPAQTASLWDPPRDIKINLFPVRQNLAANPSLEGDTLHWAATNGALVTTRTSTYTPLPTTFPFGTAAGQVTATAAGQVQVLTDAIGVEPNAPYTGSLYLQRGSSAQSMTPVIVWTLSDMTTVTVTGAAAIPGANWSTRIFITGSAPPTAVSMQFGFRYTSPGANDVQFFDAVMVEQLSFMQDYFDGGFAPSNDYSWEGNPNESISDFYPAKPVRLARLAEVLPDFIPMGATFSTLTGAAAFTNTGTPE